MRALYNEIDPFCCAWLSNLMDRGLITAGKIDDRSIVELTPDDVRGYDRVHCFAGIGVWDYALRLAGWPDDRPVWTASLPCQPFSAAGKRQAGEDERHLAPVWLRLVRECRPAIAIGEQVGAAVGMGWLDALFISLEQSEYACGAVVFPACSVGAPHIRQRLYWMADSQGGRDDGTLRDHKREAVREVVRGSTTVRLADSIAHGHQESESQGIEERPLGPRQCLSTGESGGDYNVAIRILGDAECEGLEGFARDGVDGDQPGWDESCAARSAPASGVLDGFWADAVWVPCRDGKARPTEPGTFPLAHGAPARVGRLRGYGNAIVAPQAAEFIRAVMFITGEKA